MTELQKKFVKMDKEKDEHKKFFDEYYETVESLFDELGEGKAFQDEDGTVYLTEVPKGRFVDYKTKSIVRTRREGEKKGSLSLKKAQELGFEVK